MSNVSAGLALQPVALNSQGRSPILKVNCPAVKRGVEIGACASCQHYRGLSRVGEVAVRCSFEREAREAKIRGY